MTNITYDYSNKSFSDINDGLSELLIGVKKAHILFNENLELAKGYNLEENDYTFANHTKEIMVLFKTVSEELSEIKGDIQETVREDHIKRLYSLGKEAKKSNHNIYRSWHNSIIITDVDNSNKPYIEAIYTEGIDMTGELETLIDLSIRLNDFIGKTNQKSNDKATELLTEIFETSYLNKSSVDYIEFRAEHPNELDTLDNLESKEYLTRNQSKYKLSLPGLSVLDSTYKDELLNHFEIIFIFLKNFYQQKPKEHLKVEDLSKLVGINYNETVEALKYMQEASWWGSYSSNLHDKENAAIKPAENILRHNSFNDMILQLNEWRNEREERHNSEGFQNFQADQKEKIFSGKFTYLGITFNFDALKKHINSLFKK